jgi:single-strand DNA-binding protein
VSSRSLNKVILIGNLGNDPEVRSTNNGTRVASLSLATSRQWNGQGGDKQEKTEWHKIVLWNNNRGTGLADIAEKYCKKGDKVYIEGRIEYRSWQDREGQTRYTTEIIASDMILLGGRQGGGAEVTAPAKVGAAVASPKKEDGKEGFEDFPEALDAEDDDLPF